MVAFVAFGTQAPASVFVFWMIVDPMFALWNSVGLGNNFSLDLETELSDFGTWQPGNCCSRSRVTRTGFITPFSTQARPESFTEVAIGRSGFGRSTPGAACG